MKPRSKTGLGCASRPCVCPSSLSPRTSACRLGRRPCPPARPRCREQDALSLDFSPESSTRSVAQGRSLPDFGLPVCVEAREPQAWRRVSAAFLFGRRKNPKYQDVHLEKREQEDAVSAARCPSGSVRAAVTEYHNRGLPRQVFLPHGSGGGGVRKGLLPGSQMADVHSLPVPSCVGRGKGALWGLLQGH